MIDIIILNNNQIFVASLLLVYAILLLISWVESAAFRSIFVYEKFVLLLINKS